MGHHAVLVMAVVAVGAVSACYEYEGGPGVTAGAGGEGGTVGPGGTGGAGPGGGGAGGSAGTNRAGNGGSSGSASGAGGTTNNPVLPATALPEDAPTLACPTLINGSLDVSDATQTGRHARVVPISACGTAKSAPGTAPDSSNPHLFDVYRFANSSTTSACFTFTLTDGITVEEPPGDAGADAAAGPDAAAGTDQTADAAAGDGGAEEEPNAGPWPAKYMAAYSPFYPTRLDLQFRGDVGAVLSAPQSMGITVPAGGTVDIVVYAIDVAPGGVGAYSLRCSTQ